MKPKSYKTPRECRYCKYMVTDLRLHPDHDKNIVWCGCLTEVVYENEEVTRQWLQNNAVAATGTCNNFKSRFKNES